MSNKFLEAAFVVLNALQNCRQLIESLLSCGRERVPCGSVRRQSTFEEGIIDGVGEEDAPDADSHVHHGSENVQACFEAGTGIVVVVAAAGVTVNDRESDAEEHPDCEP